MVGMRQQSPLEAIKKCLGFAPKATLGKPALAIEQTERGARIALEAKSGLGLMIWHLNTQI